LKNILSAERPTTVGGIREELESVASGSPEGLRTQESDDRTVVGVGTQPGGARPAVGLSSPLAATFKTAASRSGSPGRGPDAPSVMLDAWHASYSEPISITLAREQLAKPDSDYFGLFPGGDDRQEFEASDEPWHSICSLVITAADGTRWVGTGWLAGAHTVVTAGHCVYFRGRGDWANQWAQQVEVLFPGLGEGARPIRATEFRSVAGWVKGLEPESHADYGAILLPPDTTLPPVRLPYAAVPDEGLGREYAAVVGYCSDKPPRSLWGQLRAIREAPYRRFLFDRSVFGGLSGSPVLLSIDGVPTVVGIQQDGDFAGAAAVRITPEVVQTLNEWAAAPGPA